MDNDEFGGHTHPGVVPFASFVSLCRELSRLKPRPAAVGRQQHTDTSSGNDTRTRDLFARWVAELQRRIAPLPPGTTAVVFRLLFPDHDVRRRFGMKEHRLATSLADAFALPEGVRKHLEGWQASAGVGCMGSQLKRVLEERGTTTRSQSQSEGRTLFRVDELLDELAARSEFTCASIRDAFPRQTRRNERQIMAELFENTTPFEAALLVQVIQRDLRPLIYPLSTTDTRASLLNFNSNAVKTLDFHQAMRIWDPSGTLTRAYDTRSSLEAAADAYELGLSNAPEPVVGIAIEIPQSVKGQSCEHVLRQFKHAKRVWAEVKYDGERTQIHVVIHPNGRSEITIFSKTGRDSTLDRLAVHDTIRRALGLPVSDTDTWNTRGRKNIQNVVLEAEMVAFSDTRNQIDEFWRIANLIAETGRDARARAIQRSSSRHQQIQRENKSLDAESDDARHLALVFFDVLVHNSCSLLAKPYSDRRDLLELLIQPIPKHAFLAERYPIDMNRSSDLRPTFDCCASLRNVFANVIARHEEGLVLKADDGKYNDWRVPWVKLKRDYIPGLWDAVDVCLLGAGWDEDRARELRVGTETFTTFYFGAIVRKQRAANKTEKPHFEGWFISNYGLSREALEDLNFRTKSLEPIPVPPTAVRSSFVVETNVGTVSFAGLPTGVAMPSVILRTPVCAEVFGDRFTKDPPYLYYAPRFARLSKVFRPAERPWTDALSADELERVARKAIGHDRPGKVESDEVAGWWGVAASPAVKSEAMRLRREKDWLARMEEMEGVKPQKKRVRTLTFGKDKEHADMPEDIAQRPVQNQKRRRASSPETIVPTDTKALPIHRSMTDSTLRHKTIRPLLLRAPSCEALLPTPAPSSPLPLHPLVSRPLRSSPSCSASSSRPSSPAPPTCSGLASPPAPRQLQPDSTLSSSVLAAQTHDKDDHKARREVPQARLIGWRLASRNDALGLVSTRTRSAPILASTPPGSPRFRNPQSSSTDSLPLLIADLLQTAVVWFAQPPTRFKPCWRPHIRTIAPNAAILNAWEAFLVGCGWADGRPLPGANVGVVFTKGDDKPAVEWIKGELRTETAKAKVGTAGALPVLVLDERLLGYEEMEEERNFEAEVIFRCELSPAG